MEMERINDNTIRVLLGSEDLAERGITVLDLLGNHKQIENFFYSILDEVDKDHTFATNDSVTFQVMPSQSGLELLISRNQANQGSGYLDSDDDQADSDDDDEIQPDDNSNGVPDFIKNQLTALDSDEDHDAVDEGGYIDPGSNAHQELVLKFASFEDFISLAKDLRLEGATSDLYNYQHQYYLVLTFYSNHISMSEAKDEIAVALEYGEKVSVTSAMLSEYGKQVMATSALETARYYFKK